MLTNRKPGGLFVPVLSYDAAHGADMKSTVCWAATVTTLLAGTGSWSGPPATAIPAIGTTTPFIDVPAPQLPDNDTAARPGGQAVRVDVGATDGALSAWYWLDYIDNNPRLQVFEHFSASSQGPGSEIVQSQITAWQLANSVTAPEGTAAAANDVRVRPRIHTGTIDGPSAGLMFTLADIDLLTPGTLVDGLRVAGTGAIGADGVVIPVSHVDVKVAAATLAGPDVIFTPEAPTSAAHVTIVDSQHTRNPPPGHSVGEWLNVRGFQQAGREAAAHPGIVAIVVVHDLRQALAWLCGRTSTTTVCAAADRAAAISIGTA